MMLSTQDGTPVAVAGFYDYDDAVGYAADWPGRADIVDFGSGELLFTLTLVPGDDGTPS